MKEIRRLGLIALLATGCAHQVIPSGVATTGKRAIETPVGLTVAVAVQSFEAPGLDERAVLEHFAKELKSDRVFQGVMFPVPPGADPTWELAILGKGVASEPDANLWKSAVAHALFPLAFFIYLESDYTLELQALLLRNHEVVRSYSASSQVTYRFQINANRLNMHVEGSELLVTQATNQVLGDVAADRPFLRLASER